MRNLNKFLGGVLLLGGLVGCADGPRADMVMPNTTPVVYADTPSATASALAFDPPITIGQAGLDLSRQNHGEAAFAGFEDPQTDYEDVFTYNCQASDHSDRYERDSVTERVGVVHR